MAAQVRNLIQDENLIVHRKGKDANASNAKKTAGGVGGRKALRTITNSVRPSPQKMALKKNLLKKNVTDFDDQCQHNYNNSQTKVLVQNENLNAGCEGKSVKPTSQKRAGLGGGGRKALSNITNHKSSSSQNPARKYHHAEKVSDIEEEWFLHDHQECINSQTRGVDLDMLWKTLGFEDDMATPAVSLSQAKDEKIAMSPPRIFLEYEEIRELSPPRWGRTNNNPSPSPSPNRFFSSPMFALRSLDLQ